MADEGATRLELYKLAVEMADRVSARRAGANSFFVTLNTALAAAIGLFGAARRPPKQGSAPTFDAFGLSVAALGGVALALTWWALLRYYRSLNKAKFEVILAMEGGLPDQPYTKEWAALHPEETRSGGAPVALASWWQRNRHREASLVEQVVPFVFAAIYVLLVVRVIWLR